MTNRSHSRSCFSCQHLRQGNQKWICISISHHCARMAWPQDPDIYRQEKETTPTPRKPPLLLSVCCLSLSLLINISLLTEPGRSPQQNVIQETGGKGEGTKFYCVENCQLEKLKVGK